MEILRGEGKADVMGLRHACRSTESLGKRLLFLLGNTALVLGASKGGGGMPNLNHTCHEICVIEVVFDWGEVTEDPFILRLLWNFAI